VLLKNYVCRNCQACVEQKLLKVNIIMSVSTIISQKFSVNQIIIWMI